MKEFQELKPKIWQQLYSLYIIHREDSTEEELTNLLAASLTVFNIHTDFTVKIASSFIKTFNSLEESSVNYIKSDNDYEAYLSLLDIKELKERFATEDNYNAKKLLLAFVIYARDNPHKSF